MIYIHNNATHWNLKKRDHIPRFTFFRYEDFKNVHLLRTVH